MTLPEHPHFWTFLSNHGHVMICLSQSPDMPLREVAVKVGITERSVQRIVHDLEQAGYLIKQKNGRNNHYDIADGEPLRHPLEQHCHVGDLVRMVRGS